MNINVASKKGFTIIELLVVVAIIALIAAGLFVLFSGPRANSRDARREADMKQIQNALNLYTNRTGTYPICTTIGEINGSGDCLSAALINAQEMPAVPRDPIFSGSCAGLPGAPSPQAFMYCYASNDTGTTYVLYYNLDTNTIRPPGWHSLNP